MSSDAESFQTFVSFVRHSRVLKEIERICSCIRSHVESGCSIDDWKDLGITINSILDSCDVQLQSEEPFSTWTDPQKYSIRDNLERFLYNNIHNMIFSTNSMVNYENMQLQRSFYVYSFLTYTNFEGACIAPPPDVIDSLRGIDAARSPLRKLSLLSDACSSLCKSIDVQLSLSGGDGTVSADCLVPCLAACILRAAPMSLWKSLCFAQHFRCPLRLSGVHAYNLALLESTLHFIKNIDSINDLVNISAADFKSEAGRRTRSLLPPLRDLPKPPHPSKVKVDFGSSSLSPAENKSGGGIFSAWLPFGRNPPPSPPRMPKSLTSSASSAQSAPVKPPPSQSTANGSQQSIKNNNPTSNTAVVGSNAIATQNLKMSSSPSLLGHVLQRPGQIERLEKVLGQMLKDAQFLDTHAGTLTVAEVPLLVSEHRLFGNILTELYKDLQNALKHPNNNNNNNNNNSANLSGGAISNSHNNSIPSSNNHHHPPPPDNYSLSFSSSSATGTVIPGSSTALDNPHNNPTNIQDFVGGDDIAPLPLRPYSMPPPPPPPPPHGGSFSPARAPPPPSPPAQVGVGDQAVNREEKSTGVPSHDTNQSLPLLPLCSPPDEEDQTRHESEDDMVVFGASNEQNDSLSHTNECSTDNQEEETPLHKQTEPEDSGINDQLNDCHGGKSSLLDSIIFNDELNEEDIKNFQQDEVHLVEDIHS